MKVSCILPTRGRRSMAAQAVRCFIDQTYSERELIILDDIADRSFPKGVTDIPVNSAQVIYFLHESTSIAEKRNLCCEYAFGEIVLHWDSDDFSAPDRVEHQVQMLEQSGKSVVGYSSMLFYDERDGKAWKFVNSPNYAALGTSLCYRREFWRSHRFAWSDRYHPNCGEDGMFVDAAVRENELYSVDAGNRMVARIHSDSTNPHSWRLNPLQQSYRSVPVACLPNGFFA